MKTTLSRLWPSAFAVACISIGSILPSANAADDEFAAMVKQRVHDWQPRKDERLLDQVGWASDLAEAKRLAMFSGHSLRAGLASSAEVDERYVQKQLGHTSAEMTRRYQRRRDRFRVNLTKAAGL